jgi:hypothetical protein
MAHFPLNHHLRQTYRLLAAAAGLYLLLVGGLGLIQTWGDPLFHRGSDWALGLRVNPAASVVLLVAGLAVLAAAGIGGNVHHRVTMVLGWALMVIAMLVMTMIQTDANVFNVSMVNVIVLASVGLILVTAGLYGKVGREAEREAGREAEPASR